MMKSSRESLSAVTVVVWNRLETDAPKNGGELEVELGVVRKNWTPESGDDSAEESDCDAGESAGPSRDQVGGSIVAVVAGRTDEDQAGLAGVDIARPERPTSPRDWTMAPPCMNSGVTPVGGLVRVIVPVR